MVLVRNFALYKFIEKLEVSLQLLKNKLGIPYLSLQLSDSSQCIPGLPSSIPTLPQRSYVNLWPVVSSPGWHGKLLAVPRGVWAAFVGHLESQLHIQICRCCRHLQVLDNYFTGPPVQQLHSPSCLKFGDLLNTFKKLFVGPLCESLMPKCWQLTYSHLLGFRLAVLMLGINPLKVGQVKIVHFNFSTERPKEPGFNPQYSLSWARSKNIH